MVFGYGRQAIHSAKNKRCWNMVSDFVDQHSGFLRLTDEEHRLACVSDADFPKTARVLFEYGAEKEGYWTSEKFMTNIMDAAKIASFKYPSEKHTSCLYLTRAVATACLEKML